MLQSRLENEQFTSLPSLIGTDRSRNGFITTDRPDSSQLVDLHVYIVPKAVWKDVQHLAQNEAMEDAISAGFVRVSPNMKLCDLRESIEQSCGHEDYFPRNFIFLRSVGRCLTRVKSRQESELKVKNYRPPQTFAPEIYLLEGRHEDYAHIPCTSPTPSTASYVFGNRFQQRFNQDENDNSFLRMQPPFPRRPMRGGKHYPPHAILNDSLSQMPSTGRQSWTKYTPIGSDPDESSSRDVSKLKEEQERLRRRQAELERMRRLAEEKKARNEREEAERRRLEEEKAAAERRRLAQERAEAERRRRLEEEAAATTIQASFRGFKDRQAFKERKRRIEFERREAEARRRRQLEEEEQKRRAKELEEQRRREIAKRQEDPDSLRARLQELRARRADLEKIREEVIKNLKNIHNRITLRRKEARDMWKKKYFIEKKKTPPMEERVLLLKTDIEQIHKKTVQTMDAETKHASQMGYVKEIEMGNFLMQITRTHHDIQDVRHQVEQAKLRLTTDVKLRNQAENECRSLRHELNQAKMNLNHIKTRVGA